MIRFGFAGMCIALISTASPLCGQSAPSAPDRVEVSARIDAWLPGTFGGERIISYATGATAELSYAPLPSAEAFVRAGIHALELASDESLVYAGGAIGGGYTRRITDRVSLRGAVSGGLGRIPDLRGLSYGLYEAAAEVAVRLRLSTAFSLQAFAGYRRLATPASSLIDAFAAGVGVRMNPAGLSRNRANLSVTDIETRAVFPVLRSLYDAEPLGSATITNREDGPVENVRVWFHTPQYMSSPSLTASIERLERGETVTVPLHAVFDERVLQLTENVATSASVEAEYSFFGSRRVASESTMISFHHRNAMSWVDDRRAAAFVSSTDPGALWFARHASSIVRDRLRQELPTNLQLAIGVFEALQLFGVSYVIDPNSAYIEMSEDASVIDYLQYPSQTLVYRGGDCDDLSILYSSLLESLGIATAFITIPGHIFLAFDTGLTEATAREQFFDPGLLVFVRGRAWAPVEITMVSEGFVKAWRVGAKQWIDGRNAGNAGFLPMRENWVSYPPSGLQDASARFDLPPDTAVTAAFDSAVDRFVMRELAGTIAEYERRLASGDDPAVRNEYGIALARVGLLDEAWTQFARSARSGLPWAWNNLASVAFVREDYELAYSYYEWARTLLTADAVSGLGMARSAYEMDRYAESESLHDELRSVAPGLADRFDYLASVYDGGGRAWSMADRLAGTVWSRPAAGEPGTVAAAPHAGGPTAVPAGAQPPLIVDPSDEPEVPAAFAGPPAGVVATGQADVPARAPTQPGGADAPDDEAPPGATVETALETPADTAPGTTPEGDQMPAVATGQADAAPPAQPGGAHAPDDETPFQAPPQAPDTDTPDPEATTPLAGTPVDAAATGQADAAATGQADAAARTPARPGGTAAPDDEAQPGGSVETAAEAPPQAPTQTTNERDGTPDATVATGQADAAPRALRVEPIALLSERPGGAGGDAARPVTGAVSFTESPVRVRGGGWALQGNRATMTDRAARFAKLVIAPDGSAGRSVYEFSGRSDPAAFAGHGIHVHGRGSWDLTHYGGGDSILVWITTDAAYFGDTSPRLQIYRSHDESSMALVASVRLDGSIADRRSYRIEYDPSSGEIAVLVDGTLRLAAGGLANPPDFAFAALRALGYAEFSDLRISPLPTLDRPTEATNE